MSAIQKFLTDNFGIWTAAEAEKKSGRGKVSEIATNVYGIKKLRELILELAVRGKLVPQLANEEPAAELVKRIQLQKDALIEAAKTKKKKKLVLKDEEEWPFEIPAAWMWVTFGDVSSYIQRGKGPVYVPHSEHAVVSQKCVRWTGLDLNEVRYIDPDSLGKYEAVRYLREGDILWNSTGTGTIGRACVVPKKDNEGILVADSHVTVVRPIGILGNYLWRWIQSSSVQSTIQVLATGTTNQIELNTSTVIGHPVPLPPLAEQHRIVAKVDELMALCDQLEAQHCNAFDAHEKLVEYFLTTLTQSKSSIDFDADWKRVAENFDTLFTTEESIESLEKTFIQLAVMGKLVPPDPNDEPVGDLVRRILTERDRKIQFEGSRTSANEVFENSELYMPIPDNWAYVRLGNLARFIDYRGKTPNKVDSGIPLITAKNVRFGFISREPKEFITKEEYTSWMTRGFPRLGDLLFTTEAPLGNVASIDIVEEFALAQRVICFQLHEQAIGEFLKLAIMSKQIQQELLRSATGMTATGIKSSKLKEILIPIPPIQEQLRIVEKVRELSVLCADLKSRIADANNLQRKMANVFVLAAMGVSNAIKKNFSPDISIMKIATTLELAEHSKTSILTPLAKIIASLGGAADAKEVWKCSNFDLPSFYKQLKLEIESGSIRMPQPATYDA